MAHDCMLDGLASPLALYLQVSSADYFCKQFGPRSGPTNVGPDLDPNCLTIGWYSRKNCLKKWILKKISILQKSMQKFPKRSRVT